MRLADSIKNLVTQIVARDIAAGVELARSLGHTMPRDFAVGVRFVEDSEKTRIRMRLDDATYDVIVKLPHLVGFQSLRIVDAMWQIAWDQIHVGALTVAQVWLDKHPDAFVRKEDASLALGILDALKADDALMEKWMNACMERAKHFKYEPAEVAQRGEKP
jgi:hypothetical protein